MGVGVRNNNSVHLRTAKFGFMSKGIIIRMKSKKINFIIRSRKLL